MTQKICIFTDGACRGNPGPGGWGALLRDEETEIELYGAEAKTTNNRMELLATIEALRAVKSGAHIELWTDSQYVQKGITEWIHNWKKKGWQTANREPVKNKDLWQALDTEVMRHHVSWHWVKGHAGHVDNERADQLANRAIDQLLQGIS